MLYAVFRSIYSIRYCIYIPHTFLLHCSVPTENFTGLPPPSFASFSFTSFVFLFVLLQSHFCLFSHSPSPLPHLLLSSSSFLPPKVVRGVKNVLIIQAQIHSGPVQDNYRRSNTWSPFSWRSVYTLRCRWLWEYHYYLLVALRLSCKTRCICMKVHGISSCFLFFSHLPLFFSFSFFRFLFLGNWVAFFVLGADVSRSFFFLSSTILAVVWFHAYSS